MFKIKIGEKITEIKNQYVLNQLKQFRDSFYLGCKISIAASPNNTPFIIKCIKNAYPIEVIFEKIC